MPTTRFLRNIQPYTDSRGVTRQRYSIYLQTAVEPVPTLDDDSYDPYEGITVTGARDESLPVAILVQVSWVGWDLYVLADGPTRIASAIQGNLHEVSRRVMDGEFDDDFRFEYSINPEPSFPGDQYFITHVATPSQQVIDSFTTHDPGSVIESARESQVFTLEERLGPFGLEWQREQGLR